MERLTPAADPSKEDAARPSANAPPRTFRPRVVDISGDSLSTFSSEQELAAGRIQHAAIPLATTARTSLPAQLLIPGLITLALVQAAAIGWLLWTGGEGSSAAAATSTITSEPAGASVSVDGEARGTTPLALELAEGEHQVQVGTETLSIQGGVTSTVHVVQGTGGAAAGAKAETGTLEITTEPAGLAVSVDGVPRGVSPVSVPDVAPGRHEVAVTRGQSIVRRTVSVEAGVPTAVLVTTGSAGIPSGWLTVTAPVPVYVEENGTRLGSSDTPRLLVPVGRHDLTFVNDTFAYRVTRTVQITPNQAAAVALEPVNGTISVNAQPWGEVWIDGQRIGETPIGNLPLPIGNHEVVVRHPQLGERRRTVAVGATTPARVGIDMRQ